MKTNKFLIAALMGLAVVACSTGKTATEGEEGVADVKPVSAKSIKPSKGQIDSVSYLVGVNFGSFIKGYGFGDLNYANIEKGIKDYVKAEGDPRKDTNFVKQFKISPELMNEMFNAYLQQMSEYTAALNLEKGQAFLAKNAKKSNVSVTASGLQYTILAEGSETHPSFRDTVCVNYKGTLIDGTVFDQSPEGEPVPLVLSNVIRGWQEGMALIGEGGKITLYIPSDLAYGVQGARGAIEPNSALIFDVEIVELRPYVSSAE